MEASVAQSLFEAVANKDYEQLVRLYGANARDAIISFLSMRSRWQSSVSRGDSPRAEEKLDEFLQQLAYQESSSRMDNNKRSPFKRDDPSYYALLRELAVFLTEKNEICCGDSGDEGDRKQDNVYGERQQHQQQQPLPKKKNIEISADAERLLRDASSVFSDTRPPANFVVYEDGALMTQDRDDALGPPIFDGSVANATPPPLGGAGGGPAGGAGTILHLACALDVPLALAFLLAMGADARASHTAFRRLMIHEAACNGSIQCLTLLLELGEKFGDMDGNAAVSSASESSRASVETSSFDLPFLPRRMDRMDALAPLHLYSKQSFMFSRNYAADKHDNVTSTTDYLTLLRIFRGLVTRVEAGLLTEIDAARQILEHATLADTSKVSLVRSCTFRLFPENVNTTTPRPFMRSHHSGSSDGHGNTPLHWAAFKNETECVALLLHYRADANARAHPSGWTPLHDAAYSNSRECIALLIDAGAQVDARANSGATPLCFASQEDAAEAACLLLERGADLLTRCAGGPIRDDGTVQTNGPHSRFSGYTPLHYCAHYNAHKAARVLLRHPAARNAMEISDLSDRLPIHVAVARGSSDVLRELLHAGARVETRIVTGSSGGKSTGGGSRNGSSSRRESRHRRRFNGMRQRAPTVAAAVAAAAAPPPAAPSAVVASGSTSAVVGAGAVVAAAAATVMVAPSTPRRSHVPPQQQPVQQQQQESSSLSPTSPSTPGRRSSPSATPVSSPLLRSMIPSQPVTSSKPWNCLTQRSIDECRQLISESEQSWSPDRHSLFTPSDRRAVFELLRVGKRLEQQGTGIFIDLWPQILSFCGRGWFEVDEDLSETSSSSSSSSDDMVLGSGNSNDNSGLSGAYSVAPAVAVTPDGSIMSNHHHHQYHSNNDDDSLSLPTF